jgi:S1-C subfamily serine protease
VGFRPGLRDATGQLPLVTVPGDLLDLVLLVLASAFAVAGYRQGFIIGILSFFGFLGGGLLGIYFAPGISMQLVTGVNMRAVLAILAVFLSAVAGMLVASAVGVALRAKLRRRPATVIDAVGGALVNVTAMLLLAWLIGSLVAYAPPFPAVAKQVNDSVLLRIVDRLIPQATRPEFSALRKLLATQPYVQVFGALGAETALNVPPPDPRVLQAAGLVRDRASVVKIEGVAPTCGKAIEGSGFVISPRHVVTDAHVVAGIRRGPYVITWRRVEYPGRVVLFDPRRDIAVLYVPSLAAAPLRLARSVPFGGRAIVAGYPLDQQFTAVAARVGRAVLAVGRDIYDTQRVTRGIYPIKAIVKPGNSGGPLIAPGGRVYGMVFAAAVSVPGVGYALTSNELMPDITAGKARVTAVSTQGCQ